MYTFDLQQLATFKENAPSVQIIAQSGHARYVLFSLRAGQGLREHRTSSQISVQILSGQLDFTAQDKTETLNPGQLLLLEADIPHALTAQTDAVMLLIMTPDPQSHTLEKELFDKIRPFIDLT